MLSRFKMVLLQIPRRSPASSPAIRVQGQLFSVVQSILSTHPGDHRAQNVGGTVVTLRLLYFMSSKVHEANIASTHRYIVWQALPYRVARYRSSMHMTCWVTKHSYRCTCRQELRQIRASLHYARGHSQTVCNMRNNGVRCISTSR